MQKAINIYTPPSAAPHVTADDEAFIYDAVCRGQSGRFGDLSASVESDTVVLSGGGAIYKGHIIYVPDGETHVLDVSAGTSGQHRKDLIVAEFVKGGGDVADAFIFKVLEGASADSASNAADPTLQTGSLTVSGDINQVALFRIIWNETTATVETLADNVAPRMIIIGSSAAPSTGAPGSIYMQTQ